MTNNTHYKCWMLSNCCVKQPNKNFVVKCTCGKMIELQIIKNDLVVFESKKIQQKHLEHIDLD